MSGELRQSAQRVTGYIRAWKLLGVADPEKLGEVSITMPDATSPPMGFVLLATDLEALVSYVVGATPTESAADTVTISAEEYLDLQDAENELAALHAAGVDNWEGYDEARANR